MHRSYMYHNLYQYKETLELSLTSTDWEPLSLPFSSAFLQRVAASWLLTSPFEEKCFIW